MQEIETWHIYGLFAFASTFSVYNGQRLIKCSEPTKTPWLLWVQRNEKGLYLATFASGLLTLSSLLLIGKISVGSVVLLLSSGIISLLYVLPIKGVILREVPHMKVYLIAITWVVVLILFPTLNENKFNWTVLIHASAHALLIVAAAIPFDIRDIKFDNDSQKTIPQVIGVLKSKILSIIILLIFSVLMVVFTPQLIFAPEFYVSVGILLLLIILMNENRGDIYCAGAIDGSIGLIGLSYFIAEMLW